jgi:hypothetical protein
MTDTTPIPPIPGIPSSQLQDYYRVGFDANIGATTLTLRSDATSITLSLSSMEVVRLIRILAATLDDELDIKYYDDEEDED